MRVMRMMRICGSMRMWKSWCASTTYKGKKTTIPHLISPSIYAVMHVLELDLAVESASHQYEWGNELSNHHFLGFDFLHSVHMGHFLGQNKAPVCPEPPQAAEFLQKRLISEFFGFQWQNLAEILSLFKKYNNLRKVAVREKVWLIMHCEHLIDWMV